MYLVFKIVNSKKHGLSCETEELSHQSESILDSWDETTRLPPRSEAICERSEPLLFSASAASHDFFLARLFGLGFCFVLAWFFLLAWLCFFLLAWFFWLGFFFFGLVFWAWLGWLGFFLFCFIFCWFSTWLFFIVSGFFFFVFSGFWFGFGLISI